MGCIDVGMLLLLETNLTNMIHILKIIAVIILITYSLQLVNAQSDLLVFGGLGIIGVAVYLLVTDFSQFINLLKSKL
jgi:chromate transport protein ChrA